MTHNHSVSAWYPSEVCCCFLISSLICLFVRLLFRHWTGISSTISWEIWPTRFYYRFLVNSSKNNLNQMELIKAPSPKEPAILRNNGFQCVPKRDYSWMCRNHSRSMKILLSAQLIQKKTVMNLWFMTNLSFSFKERFDAFLSQHIFSFKTLTHTHFSWEWMNCW